MAFPLDSFTRGARFLNVTASVAEDHIELVGAYEAPGLIPALLFSVGVPWVEPCVKHVCCLWDVAERYRDHDLQTALGPTCDEGVDLRKVDLMKRSSPGSRWKVDTMIHPSFVAMLFVSPGPVFYMTYEVLPLIWPGASSIAWKSSWYGQPCHKVLYPNGQTVCIACSNAKPDHSRFVFSANWFATFQCQWVCESGYVGPNCEVSVDVVIYAVLGAVALLCMLGVALFYFLVVRRRDKPPPAVEEVPVAAQRTTIKPSEMIVFKENAPEIRIKLL
jgi:hypothetical protein